MSRAIVSRALLLAALVADGMLAWRQRDHA